MQNLKQYSDEKMLQLSGIQHYAFCPRQWALIHIDQIWEENHLTSEGAWLHENVDNPFLRETNGSDVISLRGLRIASKKLGLNGIADIVELYPLSSAPKEKTSLIESKLFKALPIEYKRGKRKISDCDRLQVTAQALILEEMLGINIDMGAIFYWEERHRQYFDIDNSLREEVIKISTEMHKLVESGKIPKPIKKSGCKSCSIVNTCLPLAVNKNVKKYISDNLNETTS